MTIAANLALACGAIGVGGLALGTYSGVREPIRPVTVASTAVHPAAPIPAPTPPPTPTPPPALTPAVSATPVAPAPAPALAAADPRAAREAFLARIRDPGHGHEGWYDSARAILGAIGEHAIGATDQGCYMAGCTATFTFASDALFETAIATTPGYAAWTGGARATPPETRAGGEVVVAVVLERPD